MPHDFLDLEFANVPIISIENPAANITLIFCTQTQEKGKSLQN